MDAEFLDTNIIIRYVARDNPDQAQRAAALFEGVRRGAQIITTCEGILVEAVQVLSSKRLYNRPRDEIRDYLTSLLNLGGLRIPRKQVYVRALDLYASTNLDFVDALTVAHMERAKIGKLISFDQDFDRIHGIIRKEPP